MKFGSNKIKWGISCRADGEMNLRPPFGDEQCLRNRKDFFIKQGISFENAVSAGLAHGSSIVTVDVKDRGKIISETDGLVTDNKDVFLTVTVGDCLPIYFFDESRAVIGLAHAGWRGVVKNIAGTMIEKMIAEFDSKPEAISVYIGPHLRKCHFEIKEDIISQFDDVFVIREGGIIRVDLLSMAVEQLVSAGVKRDNVTFSDKCTYCDGQEYFSYRRDKPEKVQSMIAFIGLV